MKKLKIKRNIRLGLIVILPIIVIGLVLYKTNIYDKDIDRVLKTDAYNYGQSERERSVSIWISWWNP